MNKKQPTLHFCPTPAIFVFELFDQILNVELTCKAPLRTHMCVKIPSYSSSLSLSLSHSLRCVWGGCNSSCACVSACVLDGQVSDTEEKKLNDSVNNVSCYHLSHHAVTCLFEVPPVSTARTLYASIVKGQGLRTYIYSSFIGDLISRLAACVNLFGRTKR